MAPPPLGEAEIANTNEKEYPQIGDDSKPISCENPWEDDQLDSKAIAYKLSKLVDSQQDQPAVLALDGRWGTGKSFMLERWQAERNKKHEQSTVYYSAWHDDFSNDPLICLAAKLQESTSIENISESVTKITKIAKHAPAIAIEFVKQLVKVSTKLDPEKFETILKEEDVVDTYNQIQEEVKKIEEKLIALTKEQNPVVIIIDELDRCRPTYAIELLERIKHLFNVAGIVFVLGMNKSQLCQSIQSVYGQIDADEYLQRFITYTISMPPLQVDQYAQVCGSSEFLGWLCQSFNLTLRQAENVCRIEAMAKRLVPHTQAHPEDINTIPLVINILAVLRIKNPSLYEGFKSGEKSADEVVLYFHDNLTIYISGKPIDPDSHDNLKSQLSSELIDQQKQLIEGFEIGLACLGGNNALYAMIRSIRKRSESMSIFRDEKIDPSTNLRGLEQSIKTIRLPNYEMFYEKLFQDVYSDTSFLLHVYTYLGQQLERFKPYYWKKSRQRICDAIDFCD